MQTLEELKRNLDDELREFTDADQLRPSIETISYAMEYILAEGDKFSEKDTLSILRALEVLRRSLREIYYRRSAIDVEKFRLARERERDENQKKQSEGRMP